MCSQPVFFSRGMVQGVRLDVPVVTIHKRTHVFCGDILSLDFRGHRVVRLGFRFVSISVKQLALALPLGLQLWPTG